MGAMDVIRLWTEPGLRAAAGPGALLADPHPSGAVDVTDPVINEITGTGPRPADLPPPACPLRAAHLAAMGA